MAITTVSIGATARDYADIGAFEVAVAAGTVAGASSGDDLIGEVFDDAVFNDDDVLFDTNGDSYASIHILPASGSEPYMTEGSGCLFKLTANLTPAWFETQLAIVTLEGLEYDADGFGDSAGISFGFYMNGVAAYFHRLIIHGWSTLRNTSVVKLEQGGVSRCMIYDCECDHTGVRDIVGLDISTNSGVTGEIANNTVHRMRNLDGSGDATGISIQNAVQKTAFNNVSFGAELAGSNTTGALNAWVDGASPLGDTNAEDDGTLSFGTTNQQNITPGDEFAAIIVGVGYLKLKSGAVMEDAGTDRAASTAVPDVETDALGNDVSTVGTDDWDIGVHELELDGAPAADIVVLRRRREGY